MTCLCFKDPLPLLLSIFILLGSLTFQIECSGDTCRIEENCAGGNCCNSGKPGSENGSCCVGNPTTNLILVQVILRHGDRLPLFTYPTDPHKNSSVLQQMTRKGLLTQKGKMDGFQLGQFLNSRYKEFLKGILIPEEVLVQSSDVERTMMTALTVCAGLFPPCDGHVPGCDTRWNGDIKWHPVPVYTIPTVMDNKIKFRKESCPAYLREFDKVYHCAMVQDFEKKHKATFEHIQCHTGIPVVNLENIGEIHDTLFIQEQHGLRLPDWTIKVYPEPMKTMTDIGFQIVSGNREMMKFNGGPLLKEVLDNMKRRIEREKTNCPKRERKQQRKIFLYSGHDTTVSAFLSTLNMFDIHQPPYASAVMIELHEMVWGGKTSKQHIVKVFYRNQTHGSPREMIIPECGNPCHFDKLTGIVRDLLISDWKRECGKGSSRNWFKRPFQSLMDFMTGFVRWLRGVCGM